MQWALFRDLSCVPGHIFSSQNLPYKIQFQALDSLKSPNIITNIIITISNHQNNQDCDYLKKFKPI